MKILATIPCYDEGLTRAAGAVVVSHGVNKGKGSVVGTLLGYAAEHGFEALVLPDGMLKACRWIWTRFYIG